MLDVACLQRQSSGEGHRLSQHWVAGVQQKRRWLMLGQLGDPSICTTVVVHTESRCNLLYGFWYRLLEGSKQMSNATSSASG